MDYIDRMNAALDAELDQAERERLKHKELWEDLQQRWQRGRGPAREWLLQVDSLMEFDESIPRKMLLAAFDETRRLLDETELDNPVVCSWCGKVKGYSTAANSHGICPSCLFIQNRDLGID